AQVQIAHAVAYLQVSAKALGEEVTASDVGAPGDVAEPVPVVVRIILGDTVPGAGALVLVGADVVAQHQAAVQVELVALAWRAAHSGGGQAGPSVQASAGGLNFLPHRGKQLLRGWDAAISTVGVCFAPLNR